MQKAIERKTVREALGDEAAPGTPGTGENVCPECKGSKEIDEEPCLYCAGTGITSKASEEDDARWRLLRTICSSRCRKRNEDRPLTRRAFLRCVMAVHKGPVEANQDPRPRLLMRIGSNQRPEMLQQCVGRASMGRRLAMERRVPTIDKPGIARPVEG